MDTLYTLFVSLLSAINDYYYYYYYYYIYICVCVGGGVGVCGCGCVCVTGGTIFETRLRFSSDACGAIN